MSTEVAKYPGTTTTRTQDGVNDWTNINNIQTHNETGATASGTSVSKEFYASNFGFAVEEGYALVSLQVEINSWYTQGDNSPQCHFHVTPDGLSNQAIASYNWDSVYGTTSYTWTSGLPSASTLNSSSYKVTVATSEVTSGRGGYSVNVDYIRLVAQVADPSGVIVEVTTKPSTLSASATETFKADISVSAQNATMLTDAMRARSMSFDLVTKRAILESEGNVMLYLREGVPHIVAKQNRIDKEGGSQIWQ